MSVNSTIYVSQITWNSLTWSATAEGGPLAIRINYEGRAVLDRTGDSILPTAIFIVDHDLRVGVKLRDVTTLLAPDAATTDLVATVTTYTGTKVITLKTVKNVGSRTNQDRAGLGIIDIDFAHVSEDGQSTPVSVA
jgi:hypothetical protein